MLQAMIATCCSHPFARAKAQVITAIFLKDTLDAANNDAELLVVDPGLLWA